MTEFSIKINSLNLHKLAELETTSTSLTLSRIQAFSYIWFLESEQFDPLVVECSSRISQPLLQFIYLTPTYNHSPSLSRVGFHRHEVAPFF